MEGMARKKCTESSALGHMGVEFTLERWSRQARRQTCTSLVAAGWRPVSWEPPVRGRCEEGPGRTPALLLTS